MISVQERLATRLKQIRGELKLTQQQMAEKLNVSRMAYRYYETGQRTPDIAFLDAVYRMTGYPMEYLLGRTDNKTPETIGYDKTIRLKAESVSKLEACSYYGALVDYIISHHHFDNFAQCAAFAMSEDYYFTGLRAMSDNLEEESPKADADEMYGDLRRADMPKAYRSLAVIAMMEILEFDESLCNEIGQKVSSYELKYASAGTEYIQEKLRKKVIIDAQKTREQ